MYGEMRLSRAARGALSRLVPERLARVSERVLALAERAVARAEARVAELVLTGEFGDVARAARALLRVERVRWKLWLRDERARIKADVLARVRGSATARAAVVGALGGEAALRRWERGAERVRRRVREGRWGAVPRARTPCDTRPRVLRGREAASGSEADSSGLELKLRLAPLPRMPRSRRVEAITVRALGVARGLAEIRESARTAWVDMWPEELRMSAMPACAPTCTPRNAALRRDGDHESGTALGPRAMAEAGDAVRVDAPP